MFKELFQKEKCTSVKHAQKRTLLTGDINHILIGATPPEKGVQLWHRHPVDQISQHVQDVQALILFHLVDLRRLLAT